MDQTNIIRDQRSPARTQWEMGLKYYLLSIPLAAALASGCTASNQISPAESQAFLKITDAKCKSLGYEPYTAKYATCIKTFKSLEESS